MGVHRATLEEVISRFGEGTAQRRAVTATLNRIYHLAKATGKLERFVVFGSYVTTKPDPNDVDIVLVMEPSFLSDDCAEEIKPLFDHQRASEELGASIFWFTSSSVFLGTVDDYIAYWQIKRDDSQRGIVEIIS